MSKELFHALLDKEFYLANKDLINEELFKDNDLIKELFRLVKYSYDTENTDSLSVPDVFAAYKARYPAETETRKNLVLQFLDGMAGIPAIQPKVAQFVLKQARLRSLHHDAAQLLLDDRNAPNMDKVREVLLEAERLSNAETSSDVVDLDIDALLLRTAKNCKWTFNLTALRDVVTGIGSSMFMVCAGRVESGKSLTVLSFCYAPEGFAEQGAKILHLCNEEDGAFPGLRAISAYTGMTFNEISANKTEAAKIFSKIKPNVHIIDNPRMSMAGLARLVDKHRPDIVLIDMLDHLQVAGEYAREDLRLGQVYRQSRELAKFYKCAVIGTSQTSAESDGKLYYGFDSLAGSKTDKAAACDLILLLGQNPPDDKGNYSLQRAINVSKNKITGWHGAVHAVIKPEYSRLVS